MFEILDKRSYVSKTFDNGDGSKNLQAHCGHIHYKGTDNSWKDVDYTIEDMGAYWQMTKASYKLFIAKDFSANQLIRFDNVYRGSNHKIYYEPKILAWVNKTNMSDIQVFRNQQAVIGQLVGTNVIRYENAFGDGIHFEITIMRSGFKKEIVIDAKNKLELPPTENHKLVALFKYTTDKVLDVKKIKDLTSWDKDGYFECEDGFKLEEDADKKSWIRPAVIVDNSENQQKIKVFWKLHNESLWQAKVLPTQFLKDAEYPVRADTTTSYYAGAGDGGTGTSYYTTFAAARNAASGASEQFSVATSYSRPDARRKSVTEYSCGRAFFPFDTSDIGSGSTCCPNFAVSCVIDSNILFIAQNISIPCLIYDILISCTV